MHRHWYLPTTLALAILFFSVGLPIGQLLLSIDWHGLPVAWTTPWIQRVILFSLWQATLSTLLSVLMALPLALALTRQQHFPGRQWLLSLISIPMILPAIVAITGIVIVAGNTGWINSVLAGLNYGWHLELYGLSGILIAHVFFNLPLALRLFLQILDRIPEVHDRLAAQLGMNVIQRFRHVEWPALRTQIRPAAYLIFTLCFTSFAIVLTLGGGPRSTTLEVAIFQALRFEFDLDQALVLAISQLLIGVMILLLTRQHTPLPMTDLSGTLQHRTRISSSRPRWLDLIDYLLITLAAVLLLLPISGIAVNAFNSRTLAVLSSHSTLVATLNTLWISMCAAFLATLTGFCVMLGSRHLLLRRNQAGLSRALELGAMSTLLISPLVLGTGLFVLLRRFADVFALGLLLIVLMNALACLPFVIRVIAPQMLANARQMDRLAASLAINGWHRLRLLEWPLLRRPLSLACALSCAFSAGDLTAVALFGSSQATTLPLLLYQRMGSYRMQEAAVTALLLLLVCILVFLLFEKAGRAGQERADHAERC